MSHHRTLSLGITLGLLAVLTHAATAHEQRSAALPAKTALSEVEIGLELTRGGGGCYVRCQAYRLVILGTGRVEYEDLGGEPRSPRQERTIPVDEVISLLNDFLAVSFFERPEAYTGLKVARREGDSVELSEQVAI